MLNETEKDILSKIKAFPNKGYKVKEFKPRRDNMGMDVYFSTFVPTKPIGVNSWNLNASGIVGNYNLPVDEDVQKISINYPEQPTSIHFGRILSEVGNNTTSNQVAIVERGMPPYLGECNV